MALRQAHRKRNSLARRCLSPSRFQNSREDGGSGGGVRCNARGVAALHQFKFRTAASLRRVLCVRSCGMATVGDWRVQSPVGSCSLHDSREPSSREATRDSPGQWILGTSERTSGSNAITPTCPMTTTATTRGSRGCWRSIELTSLHAHLCTVHACTQHDYSRARRAERLAAHV